MLFTDLLLLCKASKRMDKFKVIKPPMRVDKIVVQELKDKGEAERKKARPACNSAQKWGMG